MSLLAQAGDTGAQVAEAAGADVAEIVLFVGFGLLAVGTALAVVTMRNVVHGALMLVVNLLSIAGLYLALQSSFLSIVQVIVYAGAIVVLFLFVIMLLGVDRDDALVDRTRWHVLGALVGGLAVAALLVTGFVGTYTSEASLCGAQGELTPADVQAGRVGCAGLDDLGAGGAPADGTASAVDGGEDVTAAEFLGERLFTRHTFAFEAAGLLLVVATIGALVLGRRHDTPPDEDPAYELAYEPPDFDELADDLAGDEQDTDQLQPAGETDTPGEDA